MLCERRSDGSTWNLGDLHIANEFGWAVHAAHVQPIDVELLWQLRDLLRQSLSM